TSRTRSRVPSRSRRPRPGRSTGTSSRRPRGAARSPRTSWGSRRPPGARPRGRATPASRPTNWRRWPSTCKSWSAGSSPDPLEGVPGRLGLVIDAPRTVGAIIGKTLREEGLEVIGAGNGREGLEQLRQSPGVELVLVDWNMPEMNGLDFICAVRADRAWDAV